MAVTNSSNSGLEVPGFDSRRPSSLKGGHHGVFLEDPRSSSAQSLVPSQDEYSGKRRLLVIYIHGYQGTDTSFQSFPAHVHHFLKHTLADTHVVHSKIYPRYKTYKAMDLARDNFSRWLEPHESPTTDVILVGHSMGGLLNAEVVLMPARRPYTPGYFRHRILGTINLDAPFLGLHPGIIVSGISSLFRPKQKTPKESTTELDSSPGTSGIATPDPSAYSGFSGLSPTTTTSRPSVDSRMEPQGSPFPAMTLDPNFNPTFANDVRIKDRGWWQSMAHFVRKHHSEGIIDATTQHFMSHLEYGSTLLDYNTLKSRYESLRKLEELDDLRRRELPRAPRRVRFIQYYTMCYGIPKKSKSKPKPGQEGLVRQSETSEVVSLAKSHSSTPGISLQDHSKDDAQTYSLHPGSNGASQSLTTVSREESTQQETATGTSVDECSDSPLALLSPDPISESSREGPVLDAVAPPGRPSIDADTAAELTDAVAAMHFDLPTVPEPPQKPETPELEKIEDKAERKQAEKEAKRKQKAYEQAIKSREKVIRERQKIIDKRQKKNAQEAEKKRKGELKLNKKEDAKASAALGNNDKEPARQEEGVTEVVPATANPTGPTAGPMRSAAEVSVAESPCPVDVKKNKKKKKERMFCNLPKSHRDPRDGGLDPKWVKVFMRDMDEVGAHTGLFFPSGEHYDRLVGDVVDVVISWVQEDASVRAVLAAETEVETKAQA